MGKCNKASPIFKLKAMFTIKNVKRHRMVCIGVAGSNILAHHFLLQLSMAQRRSKSEPPKKSFAEDPSRLFRPNIHPMPAETLPPMSTVDKRWSATPRRGDISRRFLPIAYAFSGRAMFGNVHRFHPHNPWCWTGDLAIFLSLHNQCGVPIFAKLWRQFLLPLRITKRHRGPDRHR